MIISFKINNIKYIRDTSIWPVDLTLNEFIRQHARLVGTKFMCREGGCGCCTCVIKGKDSFTNKGFTVSIFTCLLLVNSCDGIEITTIEGIGNRKTGYHPIQLRLAHANGSQCGYCSVGMVMNMYGLLKQNSNLTMEELENSFGGNLCRCTGYRPILDAMKSFASNYEFEHLDMCNDIEDMHFTEKSCQKNFEICKNICKSITRIDQNRKWYVASSLTEIFEIFEKLTANNESRYTLIHGGTAHGVYRRSDNISVFIDINKVPILHSVSVSEQQLKIGANVTIATAMEIFRKASKLPGFDYCKQLISHFDLIANNQVRNVGSLAGNFMIKYFHHHFPSDLFVLFEAVDVKMSIMNGNKDIEVFSPVQFLEADMKKKIIVQFSFFPLPSNRFIFSSYKIMPRQQNANAYVNAGFLIEFSNKESDIVKQARICFGGIADYFTHAKKTEQYLKGKKFFSPQFALLETISSDINPQWKLPDTSVMYRKQLAIDLFYKFYLAYSPSIPNQLKSGATILKRELSHGQQFFDSVPANYPLTQPIIKLEALSQCAGEATYVNDFPHSPHDLWVTFVHATRVGSKIVEIDANDALSLPDVIAFFSARDIPGKNTFTPSGYTPFYAVDEPIFAESKVLYYGQPVGIIVARSTALAERASKLVKILYENQDRQLSPKLFRPERFQSPNKINNDESAKVLELEDQGTFDIGGQYHYWMEPQTTVCVPRDNGFEVYSSTQYIDNTQLAVALCLGLPQNSIQIKVAKIGGGYGGKISRSIEIACAAAIASYHLNETTRFVQSIESMMECLGKRLAFHADYEFKVEPNGKVNSFNANFLSDAGWAGNENIIDIITKIAWKSCYSTSSSWTVNGELVKTDSAANTWMRGPGSLESINLTENLMEHIAWSTGQSPIDVRLANIDLSNKMTQLLPQFLTDIEYANRLMLIKKYNENNRWKKQGLGIAVMEFGIGYFGSFSSEVVIYHSDGTVAITHAGIEMGQGVNTKVAQVAAYTLQIPLNLIKVLPSNSFTGANKFASGASVSSESVCYATQQACQVIIERLAPIKAQAPNKTWQQIITAAYLGGVNLKATGEMTPASLQPYTVQGISCSEVEVDMLTGNIILKRVDILEDTGQSMSPLVDVGQVEGAFVMGLGYWLTERLVYDNSNGKLMTNRSWYYKIPGAKDIPVDFRVTLLQKSTNPAGFMRSKATGEPAICLAISAIHAIRMSLQSSQQDAGLPKQWIKLNAPTTPEDILLKSGTTLNSLKL